MIVRDTAGREVSVLDTAGRVIWGGGRLDTPRIVTADLWRTGRVTTGRTAGSTYYSPHRVRVDARNLRLTYGGQLPAGVTMDLAASVTIGGKRHQVTWSGDAANALIGAATVESDPLPVRVKAGESIEVLTYYGQRSDGLAHPAAPGCWYSTQILPGDRTITGAPSQTPAEKYDGYNGYRPVMPHAITGLASGGTTAWALLGDSITEGGSPALELIGPVSHASRTWGVRHLDGSHPVVNTAIWGSTYATSRSGMWATIPDLSTCTDAIVAWGYNDLDQAWQLSARDVAYVQRQAIECWTWVSAEVPRIYQSTVTPSTSSTDGWMTIAGQSPRPALPYRQAFNAWLRDGAPIAGGAPVAPDGEGVRAGEDGHPLAGIIDTAAMLEHEVGSGIFRVDRGPLTTDGGHPNVTGHDLMAQALA